MSAAALLLILCLGGDEPARNVILFGWDGAQRNHVNQCLRRGELPTLQGFVEHGVCVEIDIVGTTDTKAGWTQILTGYFPEVTGVHSNMKFRPIPRGLTIGERLEEHFGPDGIVTLAVAAKADNVGATPPRKVKVRPEGPKKRRNFLPGRIVEEGGVQYRLIPGLPYLNTAKGTDHFENGLRFDEVVATKAMDLIEQNKDRPFFIFVHFAEVDHSGHKFGENSEEYNDALISNDLWTGRIIEKVKALGLGDRTNFYITSDHGFDEGAKAHKQAPYVFLASNDTRIKRGGHRQDVAPTILEAYGIDIATLKPPLDGTPLTRLDLRPPRRVLPDRGWVDRNVIHSGWY